MLQVHWPVGRVVGRVLLRPVCPSLHWPLHKHMGAKPGTGAIFQCQCRRRVRREAVPPSHQDGGSVRRGGDPVFHRPTSSQPERGAGRTRPAGGPGVANTGQLRGPTSIALVISDDGYFGLTSAEADRFCLISDKKRPPTGGLQLVRVADRALWRHLESATRRAPFLVTYAPSMPRMSIAPRS